MSAYQQQILILTGINVISALGLSLISGFTGQLSLGHAGFFGVGAYISALLTTKAQLPFALALVVGAFSAGLAGLVVGFPTLRLKGDYLAIATLGFGEIMRVLALNLKITGGPVGIRGIPHSTWPSTVILLAVLAYLLLKKLIDSHVGKTFIAVREDETAAEAMGLDTARVKISAFVIGAIYAGVAGGLYAHYIRYINPSILGFMKSIEILCMVVLGGMGSLPGTVAGTVILTVTPELLRSVSPLISQYRQVIYGVLLIVLMLCRPQGLFGGATYKRERHVPAWKLWGRRESANDIAQR
ncbi:MAG TPA: branched-chain amino acid ABC transporter permease [Firmicutes bacterium]|nr:branched-chain amino acid ABC transporter permease [Bacillota bacterium]